MSFEDTLATHFPGAVTDGEYVTRSYAALRAQGFQPMNTFAGVGLCRDELTRPLSDKIRETWGETFNISSLAGMLFLGTAGFTASLHHAPDDDQGTRHIYFAMPHIGINSGEEIGWCYRSGQRQISKACGALVAFREELESGTLRVDLDPDNLEQSMLKQRLIHKLRYGKVPGLITMTKLTHEAILEDLERMIRLTIDTSRSHYAVLTGIQIHGPHNQTYIWPGKMYAVVEGKRHPLSLEQPGDGAKKKMVQRAGRSSGRANRRKQ